MKKITPQQKKIIFILFLCMFFVYPPVVNSVSVFIEPITSSFSVSAGKFTFYVTIMSLMCTVTSPVIGHLLAKIDVRKIIAFGLACLAVSLYGFALASNIFWFYALALVQGVGLAATCIVPPSSILNQLFPKDTGFALGIVMAGGGIGGGVFNPVVHALIQRTSWRVTYALIASILLVLIPFVCRWIQLSNQAERKSGPINQATETGPTYRQMFKAPAFYLMILSVLLGGIIINGNNLNIFPFLKAKGIGSRSISFTVGFSLACTTFGKIIVGKCYDKLGTRKTFTLLGIASILFISCLVFGQGPLSLIGYGLFFGISAANVTVTPAILTRASFGTYEYGKKYGVTALFMSLSSAITPLYTSMVMRISADYQAVFNSYFLVTVLVFSLMFVTIKLTRPYFVSTYTRKIASEK